MFSARFLRSITKIQRPEEASRFLRLDRYWCAEVAEPLIERVDQLVALKPKQALALAEIAAEMVRRMRAPARELQAHSFCTLATAQRAAGKLADAEISFQKAEELAKGYPAPLNAMILRQKAVLILEKGNSAAALDLARKAVAMDRAAGVFPLKSLIGEAIVRVFSGDCPGGSACLVEILENAEPDTEDYAFAVQNYVISILQRPLLASEVVETREILRKTQDRIRGIRSTAIRYVIWHTEGLLHLLMVEYRLAINHFLQARSGFLRLEQMADYARVSIDLVEALMRKNDKEKARSILQRTAKEIAEFPDYQDFAKVFQQAQEQPLEEAAQFARSRFLSLPLPEQSSGSRLITICIDMTVKPTAQ